MSISVKRSEIVQNELALIDELVQLIENSKKQVSVAVNSTLTLLFWNVGMRINNHILDNKRAEYGKQIVPTVSAQFSRSLLPNQIITPLVGHFASFPIANTLRSQLTAGRKHKTQS
jgi:hypothetical protein